MASRPQNEKEFNEAMEKVKRGEASMLNIPREHFILAHDLFAMVLNAAQEMSRCKDNEEEGLSMEEIAGRMLVVTVLEMDKAVKENPEMLEEALMSLHLQEAQKQRHLDTMYG